MLWSLPLVVVVSLSMFGGAQGQEFKIIGGSPGNDPAMQEAMLNKLKQSHAAGGSGGGDPDIKVPKQKSYSAEDMAAMGYKTRRVPPPKESNETVTDHEMRKAFALQDDDGKVHALALQLLKTIASTSSQA